MAIADYGTDGFLSTTLDAYRATLEDNVFTSKPLLWALKNAGRIQDHDGGAKLVVPLIYGESPNAGSYKDDDVFATAANSGISAAEFNWDQFYGLFHVTGIERAKNSGKHALLSLVEARMQQLEMTIAEQMNTMFFGDGSGNSGDDWWGLAAAISATDPSIANFGDIDRDTYTWWKPATKTASTVNTLALTDMANVYNTASEGNDHPTNVFTTQTGFESYEALLTDNMRYTDPKMGDAGFQNLMYKGAPITFDASADVASTTEANAPMWMVNMKYITLYKLSSVWFKPSDFMQPTNQDVFYKHLLCYGQLVASNVKRQGVLYDIHA